MTEDCTGDKVIEAKGLLALTDFWTRGHILCPLLNDKL